jgi:sulfate adenylyltransferase
MTGQTQVLPLGNDGVNMNFIAPHGGTLINRIRTPDELGINLAPLPKLEINERALSDLECIATGVYSPLTGFVGSRDHACVVEQMRLENGLPWSIPITLSHDTALSGKVVLTYQNVAIGLLEVIESYTPDRHAEAQAVYRTTDPNHPGVAALLAQAPVNLAGEIWLFALSRGRFATSHFTPLETRAKFAELGWRSVVAFQTRNPVHRAHEYLHKVALETIDGLFLHPLVGETKSDDVPVTTRMAAYDALLTNYYPEDRVLLGVYPAAMRYAGPREAILHAISRKNYGCTHFIVGRDHAGVGSYYGTYDAQEIFSHYTPEEIGIEIIKFEHTFYCKKCGAVVSSRTCPHDKAEHLVLSGTKVRELLSAGAELPPEFSRPEVAAVLRAAYAT